MMTDANGITISNIAVSAEKWAPGESGTISFKLTNNSDVKIVKLILEVGIRRSLFTGDASDISIILQKRILGLSPVNYETVNLAIGKSKTFAGTFSITEETAQYFKEHPEIRMVQMCLRYIVVDAKSYGWYGTFDLPEMQVINCRFLPRVVNFSLERAKNGVPDNEGESVLASLKLSLADTGYDYSQYMTARIYQSQMIEATLQDPYTDIKVRIPELLAGVVNDTELIPDVFSKSFTWHFLLVFGDEYESVYSTIRLDRSFANMHLSGLVTGGVCFGGFSRSQHGKPLLESHYPFRPYGGIEAVDGGAYTQELSFDEDAPFAVYVDNPLPPTLRVFGHVVEIQGEIQPTKMISGGTTYHPICTLPVQYAPEHDLVSLQQGSSQTIWMLRIFGRNHPEYPCKVMFARYRNGASWADAAKTAWLPFHAVWNIEGDVSGENEVLEAMLLDAESNPVQDANGSGIAVLSATDEPYRSRYTGDQIDAGIGLANTALQRSGGTMSGALKLLADPIEDSHATRKDYVDQQIEKNGNAVKEYVDQRFNEESENTITSWKNIPDKPFGGPITGTATIDGDTLKWDADYANMPVFIGSKYNGWAYVSDNVPTKAEMQSGYELYNISAYGGSEIRINVAPTYYDNGNIYIGDIDGAYLRVVAVPDATYTRAGVYFNYNVYTRVIRLKINGFTWTESDEVAPIPKDMLPEDNAYLSDVAAAESRANANIAEVDNRFEDTTIREIKFTDNVADRLVVSDAITGNTFAHVTYDAPAASLVEGGYELTVGGETYSRAGFTYDGDGYYNLISAAWVIARDNLSVTIGGNTTVFPKKGTYFMVSGNNKITTALTSAAMQAQAAKLELKAQYIPALPELILQSLDGRKYRITIDENASLVIEAI